MTSNTMTALGITTMSMMTSGKSIEIYDPPHEGTLEPFDGYCYIDGVRMKLDLSPTYPPEEIGGCVPKN